MRKNDDAVIHAYTALLHTARVERCACASCRSAGLRSVAAWEETALRLMEELRGLQRHAGSVETGLLMEMRGTSFEFRILRSFADADPWCGIAPLPPIEERTREPVCPL